MKKTKLTALLLAFAMSLSLAACGSDSNGANSPAPSGNSSAPESQAPANDGTVYNLRMSCEASEGQWLASGLCRRCRGSH